LWLVASRRYEKWKPPVVRHEDLRQPRKAPALSATKPLILSHNRR
jgi:hypothetical protein